MSLKVDIKSAAGEVTGSIDLPAATFDVQTNVPLIHQVVVAQLAAARAGTAKTKNRGEVSGTGKKPLSRRAQVAPVRVQFVHLCNVTVEFHMDQFHVHMINAHQRR